MPTRVYIHINILLYIAYTQTYNFLTSAVI